MDVLVALDRLRLRRALFHSEADFQHSLAWEIQLLHPDARIRLESKPLRGDEKEYLDIRSTLGTEDVHIELKYKTRAAHIVSEGEDFFLESHGAQPINRSLFWHDVGRLERFIEKGSSRGVAVFLTNDPSYWSAKNGAGTSDEQFRLFEGRRASGTLQWSPTAHESMKRQGKGDTSLRGQYTVSWRDWSRLGGEAFRYVVLDVRS